MRAERLLLVAGLLMTSGCYGYSPTRLESIQPGEPIRIRVTPNEAERLEAVRNTDIRLVDGVFVENSNDRLFLDTQVGRIDPLTGGRTFLQRLDIPLSEVVEVEQRYRDNLRTGLAVGSLGAAVGAVLYITLSGAFGGNEDPGEGPIEDRRFPITLRLGVPF